MVFLENKLWTFTILLTLMFYNFNKTINIFSLIFVSLNIIYHKDRNERKIKKIEQLFKKLILQEVNNENINF